MKWASLVIGALLIGFVSRASADSIQISEGSTDPPGVTFTFDLLDHAFAEIGVGESFGPVIQENPTWTVTDFHRMYNILEPGTGAISDLLEVTGTAATHTVSLSFTSDPAEGPLVPFVNPTLTITETGGLQPVDTIASYATDPTGTSHDLTLFIQSDVEGVPEPTTVLLLGAGTVALGWSARLTRRRQ